MFRIQSFAWKLVASSIWVTQHTTLYKFEATCARLPGSVSRSTDHIRVGAIVGVIIRSILFCLCQANVLIIPCMLAHLLTDGIPFHFDNQFLTYVPVCSLTVNLYQWLDQYMDKIQQDLLKLGLWDQRSSRCPCSPHV